MSDSLLLIDFVNDIVHPEGKIAAMGTPAHVVEQQAIANARRVLDSIRERQTKVVFVRVAFSEGHSELDGLDAPFYAAHRANGWLVRDTWGTEFHSDLQPLDSELVIEKNRVNPFSNPELVEALQGIDRLVIMGVATNLAVEETVRNGAALGFDVVVLEDCCASNNQEVHDFAVNQIFPKFATVTASANYLHE